MSSELKACPFCRSGVARFQTDIRAARVWFHVRCDSCGAGTLGDKTGPEAAAAWNRRTPSPAVLALVEACRDLKLDDALTFEGNLDAHAFFSVDALNDAKDALAAVEREIGGA